MDRFVRQQFDSDVFITDYTQYRNERIAGGATNEQLNKEGIPEGVDVSSTQSVILHSVHLINKHRVSVAAVNFEKNMQYFRDAKGQPLSQCECLTFADGSTSKGWLMLHELKYCKADNIGTNFDVAVNQIEKTYLHLRDDFQDAPFLQDKQYHYYWVISIPEHSEESPFDGFIYDGDKVQEMKEQYGCTILGVNKIEILTTAHVRAVKEML